MSSLTRQSSTFTGHGEHGHGAQDQGVVEDEHEEVLSQLRHYERKYRNNLFGPGRASNGTQTRIFRENIPLDLVDFTEAFDESGLIGTFTSDKIVTEMMGNYNCNHLYRQTKVVPDIVVFSDDKHVVFQPLGEPGRDLGSGHGSKASHLMVVTYSDDGPITMNEMLPTTAEEDADLKIRLALMDSAYKALRENTPISECGPMTIGAAATMGVPVTMGVMEFMAKQIAGFTPEFRSGRPGYKLLNKDDLDFAGFKEQNVQRFLAETFSADGLTVQKFIQGPDNCSQILSHVHGFLLHPWFPSLPQVIAENYIDVTRIMEAKAM